MTGIDRETKERQPFSIACLFASVGETDSAFAWLERAYRAHQTDIVSLKVEPALDRLRSDARYRALVRQVHLDRDPPTEEVLGP